MQIRYRDRRLITVVSVIKRLSLYEINLWGRDFVSVVRIRESRYYGGFFKKIYENFSGHALETVRNREVSLPRDSTVFFSTNNYHVKGLNPGVISKVG